MVCPAVEWQIQDALESGVRLQRSTWNNDRSQMGMDETEYRGTQRDHKTGRMSRGLESMEFALDSMGVALETLTRVFIVSCQTHPCSLSHA